MSGDTPALSKNVLQLKFMQRSVLQLEEEKNAEERQRAIDEEHWVLDLPQLAQREERFIQEPSYEVCANLLFGRMSFQGFNPEVEKLMKQYSKNPELEEAAEREAKDTVSDTEMTNRYSSLVGIISKKFSSKRRHREQQEAAPSDSNDNNSSDDQLVMTTAESASKKKKKRKFLKPDDS